MHQKKFLNIPVTLFLLILAFILLFVRLGFWQLSRAKEKKILIAQAQSRLHGPTLTVNDISKNIKTKRDLTFYPIRLAGHFDNQHSFLLDNAIKDNKIGYTWYVPFKIDGTNIYILVDRQFLIASQNRKELPAIEHDSGTYKLSGVLVNAPKYFALGSMIEKPNWPQRVEFIDLNQMAKLLKKPLFYEILALKSPSSISRISPQRHFAYAVQWFALALTLLILFGLLNRSPRKERLD